MEFDSYDEGDDLAVTARLRDVRPWDDRLDGPLHDMELRVRVRKADRMIVGAVASMGSFPHTECPAIEAAFRGLEGMVIGGGFLRAVAERFGGVSGCAHLDQLARALGPAVFQALMSAGLWDRRQAGGTSPVVPPGRYPVGTCHIWAEDGVAVQKLALGWEIGNGEMPVPALETFRARPAADDEPSP
jgi:hypothetical protein